MPSHRRVDQQAFLSPHPEHNFGGPQRRAYPQTPALKGRCPRSISRFADSAQSFTLAYKAINVRAASGRGNSRKIILVMIPSVPSEPHIKSVRS